VSIIYTITVEIYTGQQPTRYTEERRKGPENDDKDRGHTACAQTGWLVKNAVKKNLSRMKKRYGIV